MFFITQEKIKSGNAKNNQGKRQAAMTTATLTLESANQQTQPERQKKNWLSWAFKKAADVGARAALTNTLKIAAATTMIGAGASSMLTIGVTMIATGVGAGLYTYLKDYAVARWMGEDVDFWDAERLRKAKWALLTGAAGGAFGAWLAGTDTFQAGLSFAKEYGLKALGGLSDIFMGNAYAAPVVAAVAAAAPAVADVAPAKPTSLSKLWEATMKTDTVKGKAFAEMLAADPDKMKSVSPQFLKDRAHDVLRMKDIPFEERLKLARELATEAKERGNKQAVQFLKDLVKLEKFAPKIATLPDVVVTAPRLPDTVAAIPSLPPAEPIKLPEIVAELPVIEIPETPRVVGVVVETEHSTGETADRVTTDNSAAPLAVETVTPAETTVVEATPARTFNEAAVCNISGPDAAGAYDADCQVQKAEMQPGDYVTFKMEGAADTTALTEDSVPVKTESFLHEQVVADGINKVSAKRPLTAAAFP